MKKLLLALALLFSISSYAQQPSIGHFQQLATVKRGDTLDVAWYYQPITSKDVRTFQVDFQYKKRLLSHIETTVDVAKPVSDVVAPLYVTEVTLGRVTLLYEYPQL